MSKNRKANKPFLRPAALSLLAQRCGESEWDRILDLREISLEALLDYVKAIAPPDFYQQFLETQMSAEELAARHKAEADKKEAAERESRTIHNGKCPSPYTNLQRGSVAPLWRDATLTEAERIEAERLAEIERSGIRPIENPEFDPV